MDRIDRIRMHIEEARYWLARAGESFTAGNGARGELDLSLAQAEARYAWEISRGLAVDTAAVDIEPGGAALRAPRSVSRYWLPLAACLGAGLLALSLFPSPADPPRGKSPLTARPLQTPSPAGPVSSHAAAPPKSVRAAGGGLSARIALEADPVAEPPAAMPPFYAAATPGERNDQVPAAAASSGTGTAQEAEPPVAEPPAVFLPASTPETVAASANGSSLEPPSARPAETAPPVRRESMRKPALDLTDLYELQRDELQRVGDAALLGGAH